MTMKSRKQAEIRWSEESVQCVEEREDERYKSENVSFVVCRGRGHWARQGLRLVTCGGSWMLGRFQFNPLLCYCDCI